MKTRELVRKVIACLELLAVVLYPGLLPATTTSVLICPIHHCFIPIIWTASADSRIPSAALELPFIKSANKESVWDFKTTGECTLWEVLSLYNVYGECSCASLFFNISLGCNE